MHETFRGAVGTGDGIRSHRGCCPSPCAFYERSCAGVCQSSGFGWQWHNVPRPTVRCVLSFVLTCLGGAWWAGGQGAAAGLLDTTIAATHARHTFQSRRFCRRKRTGAANPRSWLKSISHVVTWASARHNDPGYSQRRTLRRRRRATSTARRRCQNKISLKLLLSGTWLPSGARVNPLDSQCLARSHTLMNSPPQNQTLRFLHARVGYLSTVF